MSAWSQEPAEHSGARGKGPVDLRLLRLAGRHRGQLLWLIVLSVLRAVTVVATALAGALTVVLILRGGAWQLGLFALAAALVVRAIVLRLLPPAAHRVATSVITTVREEALETVARKGPAWVASRGARPEPVDVAGLLATGLDPLRPWFATYLPSLVVAVVLPPSVLGLMAWLDLRSMVVVALTLPLVPVFGALVGWATQRRAKAQYDRGGYLAGHFLDVVRGLATLKLVDRAKRQVPAVRETSAQYARSTTRVLSVAFLSSTALDLVTTLSVGLVAVGAGVRLAGGEMLLGPALAVILLAPEAFRPLREAGAQFHESAQAGAVMDQLAAFHRPQEPATTAVPAAPVGARNLRVTYPGRRTALHLPDLDVRPGELVVLSGPSGSGKTTMLRVLAGVQQPAAGSAWAPDAQYLPQRPALPLARTAGEALAVEPGREPEALQVLERLGLPAQALPHGLATALGDDATGLSAGQRHRLALARVILAVTGPQAPARATLLLDEPTAHLDGAAEAAVIAELQELTGRGITVLAAAHRSPLLEVADRRIDIRTVAAGAVGNSVAATAPGNPTPESGEPASGSGEPAVGGPQHAAAAGRTGPAPSARSTVPQHSGRRQMLARSRRWWSALPARTRFLVAAIAGAASMLSGIGLTVAASWLIVRAAARPPILTLSIAVVAVRAFAIARPLLGYAQRLAAHDGGLSQLATWRSRVVADLLPQVPGRLTHRRGRLLGRVVQDVDQRLSGVVAGVVPLTAAALSLAAVAAGVLWLAPPAVVPLLASLAVAGLLIPVWAARADSRGAGARDRAQSDLHDGVVGAVENAEELTGARGRQLRAELARRGHRVEQAEATAARTDGRGSAASELGAGVLVLGSVLVAGTAWGAGTISAELAGVLVLGALAVTAPVQSILPAVREAAAGRRARRRLAGLHLPASVAEDTRPDQDTRSGPGPAADPGKQAPECEVLQSPEQVLGPAVGAQQAQSGEYRPEPGPSPATGVQPPAAGAPGLVLDQVVAAWAEVAPLRGVDLQVHPGEAVLIEGESGTGKSTLAAALTGLLPLSCGQISLHGRSIEDVPGHQWRHWVGLAGEPDHIFATTVRQNLLLARPEATDADLVAALQLAQLGPWLEGLSQGLDTWLDSGGRVLSGGERRRLVLARALLREPEVLILDEPTEGLDAPTAQRLLTGLLDHAGAQGQMLVIFSHRLEGLDQVRRRYRLHTGQLQTALVAV